MPTKTVRVTIMICALLSSASQCFAPRRDDPEKWRKYDIEKKELESEMEELAKQINETIQNKGCDTTPECKTIGVGYKSCGHMAEHLVYSTLHTDGDLMRSLVAKFNRRAERLNKLSYRVEKCGIPAPKTQCIKNECRPVK